MPTAAQKRKQAARKAVETRQRRAVRADSPSSSSSSSDPPAREQAPVPSIAVGGPVVGAPSAASSPLASPASTGNSVNQRPAGLRAAPFPPLATVCTYVAEFFASLNATSAVFYVDAQHNCLRCGHPICSHAARPGIERTVASTVASPSVPDVYLRTGPPLTIVLSPGEEFRNLLADWKNSPHLLEDREAWDKAFAEISSVMFNRSTEIIFQELTVDGKTATTRKWALRNPDITVERAAILSLALRLARDLGLAVLSILRFEARYRWKVLDAVVNVMDKPYEIPIEVFLCEQIRQATVQVTVGDIIPPEESLTDPDYPTWGLLAITLRTRSYLTTLRKFFTDYTSAWTTRAENKNAFMAVSKFRSDKRAKDESAANLLVAAAVVESARRVGAKSQREPSINMGNRGDRGGGKRRRRNGRGNRDARDAGSGALRQSTDLEGAGAQALNSQQNRSLNPSAAQAANADRGGNPTTGGRGNFRGYDGAGRGRGRR